MNTVRTRTDWWLLWATLFLVSFGLVMVYSASAVSAEVYYHKKSWEFAVRQLVAALIGLPLMLWLKYSDYRRLRHGAAVFVPLVLVLLLLGAAIVLDPRAHRWIRVPGIGQFQPSEMAKPVIVVYLAWFVASRGWDISSRFSTLPTVLVLVVMTALIAAGDLGTALIVLTPALAVYFVAGIGRRPFMVALLCLLMLAAAYTLQRSYRVARITKFFGLTEEKIQQTPSLRWLAVRMAASNAARDDRHQVEQSMIAIGRGGLTGVGLGGSTQKLGFLPEAHTDFILGVIGEETGFLGCAGLLAAYLVIFWRGLRAMLLLEDPFGRYLALGATTVIVSQALANMLVALDAVPTKGMPLPLVSYGGSSLVCTLITMGLLMSVCDRAPSR
ncbi:MAG: FtsW/RodA/SpoVE family cell cycle protein [Bryobacteraceae bacterium]|nr:FtsW/RodA/SpoVE family cell cycle protein [Bryobacteraceae bacterium]